MAPPIAALLPSPAAPMRARRGWWANGSDSKACRRIITAHPFRNGRKLLTIDHIGLWLVHPDGRNRMTIAESLADHIASVSYDRLPAEAVH